MHHGPLICGHVVGIRTQNTGSASYTDPSDLNRVSGIPSQLFKSESLALIGRTALRTGLNDALFNPCHSSRIVRPRYLDTILAG
jgi:hypothetical protein